MPSVKEEVIGLLGAEFISKVVILQSSARYDKGMLSCLRHSATT